jgi:hypothetical protein
VRLGLSMVLARELGLLSSVGIVQARGLQMRRDGALRIGSHGEQREIFEGEWGDGANGDVEDDDEEADTAWMRQLSRGLAWRGGRERAVRG